MYLISLVLIIVIYNGITFLLINYNCNFKFASNPKFLVLGNSHSEHALNDSLIPNLKNLSQGGESYYYTYQKAKKVLEQNPEVSTVFIEYSNIAISYKMKKWIWDDQVLRNYYVKYSPFLSLSDEFLLVSNNLSGYLNAISPKIKERGSRIFIKKINYTNDIGGYFYQSQSKIDSLLNNPLDKSAKHNSISKTYSFSNVNNLYLLKLINLCKSYNKKIILVRCPIHPQYELWESETIFQETLKKELNGIEFLDFSKFELSNDEFRDFDHLNYKGAIKFSKHFNNFLNSNF